MSQSLHQDEFQSPDAADWAVDLEAGGSMRTGNGRMEIESPRGCTVWFRHELTGPLLIEYQVTMIAHGGPYDRVSDMNCFWMAHDPARPSDFDAVRRSGKFADYDDLLAYYVGHGGNNNTTTRFRRYIGRRGDRPLLPQHERSTAP